jgi:hypothetical protein
VTGETSDEGDEQRSEVVPLLVAALVCDSAFQDPATGKTSLIGVFDRVNARAFPSVHAALSLFVKMVDAEGFYDVSIKIVHAESGQVLAQARAEMKVGDRLSPTSFVLPLQQFQLPGAGTYDFQIWANDTYLGSASLQAVLLTFQRGESNG